MSVDYLSELGKNAKRIYVDKKYENLQNMAADTFPKIKKSSKKLQGDGLYGGNVVQGNQAGQGSQNELEALRMPDKQHMEQYKISPKVFTHTFRSSGLSLKMLEGNEAAFADNLLLQMDEGIKDATKELNAQCYRDGSGVIALVNGTNTATSLVFDTGVPTHFRYGMYIDVITAAGVVEFSNVQVTDINISTLTLTIASNTFTDNSYICRAGTLSGAPTDGKEMAGFPRITDDGTAFASYEGLVRNGSGYIPLWKGLEINASSANLTDDLMQRARYQALTLGGTKVNKIKANSSQERKYLSLTLPQVRFNEGEKRDTASVDTKKWSGIDFEIDTDCGFGDIWMYDDSYINKFEPDPLKWDDTNGNILKWDTQYDAFIGYAKYYGNIGTDKPRAMIRIKNLATPTF